MWKFQHIESFCLTHLKPFIILSIIRCVKRFPCKQNGNQSVYLPLPYGIILYFKAPKTSMIPVWICTLSCWFHACKKLQKVIYMLWCIGLSLFMFKGAQWIWFHCMELLKHYHGTTAVTAEWYFKCEYALEPSTTVCSLIYKGQIVTA